MVCTAGTVFTGGTSCYAAIVLTVELVPVAGYFAGQMGGHAIAEDYDVASEYLEDLLINSSEQQFTITISPTDHTTVLLPGGVGPTNTVYEISVDGYSQSTYVYNGNVINSLFGVRP